jgi:hypothetical protein
MRIRSTLIVAAALVVGTPSLARAQRFPFERTFDVQDVATLDISTLRGRIDVGPGLPGRIVVTGVATVRIAWDAPSNAVELARRVADHPPIERDGSTVRLRPPSDTAEQKATTVSYTVRVPPTTEVRTDSDSGATTVRGIEGPVTIRTQSAAIDVGSVGATTSITTGSGAVKVDGSKGALRVKTGSSAITLRGARGGVTATSQSGHVTVAGIPGSPWTLSTGSSAIDIAVDRGASLSVDASSRSGSVKIDGGSVQGDVSKKRVAGTIGAEGPLVRATSGSGSITMIVGR